MDADEMDFFFAHHLKMSAKQGVEPSSSILPLKKESCDLGWCPPEWMSFTTRIVWGISDLYAYMADAHTRFISGLFPHMSEACACAFFPPYSFVGHIRSVPHGRTN